MLLFENYLFCWSLKASWSQYNCIFLLISTWKLPEYRYPAAVKDRSTCASCLSTLFLNCSVGSRWSTSKQIPIPLQQYKAMTSNVNQSYTALYYNLMCISCKVKQLPQHVWDMEIQMFSLFGIAAATQICWSVFSNRDVQTLRFSSLSLNWTSSFLLIHAVN